MKFKCKFILLFILVAIPSAKIATSQDIAESKKNINLSTPFLESMLVFSQMKLIYTEAFDRIGFGFKLYNNPGERSLIEVGSGNLDGEAARIEYLNKNNDYPSLIRVNESIITLYDGAYAVNTSIKVDGWASLEEADYDIGILKGIKSVEAKLAHHVDKKSVVHLSNTKQLIKMLLARRIDLFIISTQIENSALMESPQTKSIKRVGIAGKKVLYPYMHKKYKDLSFKLAKTLKAMKKDGAYEKLLKQAQKEHRGTKK